MNKKTNAPAVETFSIDAYNRLKNELSEKNIRLFKDKVELTETRNTLEDRNYELEKLNKSIVENNLKLTQNAMALTETTNELEDTLVELRAANEQLKALDSARSEFISIASHELRTPLTSIIGFIDLLRTESDIANDKQKLNEFLDITFSEAKKLHHLINDLLDLSKMDAGKMNFSFQKGDLKEVCNRIFMEASLLASQKGITIYKLFHCNDTMAVFDHVRIEEALSNLVNNALKILSRGGTVHIELSLENKTFLISVSDNGPGIPKEKLGKLFHPFSQVEDLVNHHEGTGLGLAITKKIIEAHGGNITVESELRKGTKFTFSIPQKRTTIVVP